MKRALFFIVTLFSVASHGQIDPSSALLLNSGSPKQGEGSEEKALDSGRYTVRPREGAKREPKKNVYLNMDGTQVQADPAPTVSNDFIYPQPKSVQETAPVVPPVREAYQPKIEARPAAGEDAAGPGADGKSARGGFHPDDRRLNLLELSLAPVFIYNNSDSSYWFRSYHSASPGFKAGANVWFTPEFGLKASYLTSTGAHVSNATDHSENISVTHQWINAGLRGRKFFDATRTSPVLTFGADFQEYQFSVPSDALMRQKLKTTGINLSLGAEIPSSANHAWTVDFGFSPKARHRETATGIDAPSGSKVDANIVSFGLGGRQQFNHANAVYWRISHTVEKDLFSGSATVADPISGTTPKGVPVTNTFTVFELGYIWGN